MKKPLTQTKVTVKLRQAVNKSRWYHSGRLSSLASRR